nr:LysR family transcriptional regulator [uncultured Noviherbaspirillum sp.]
MEFRHLRYFVVLADELHFGRAAKRLSISQPPLSLNIQQLEGSLGVTLFERNSKGVKLTPAGVAFREAALRLLAETEQARDVVQQVARGVLSQVRIGFVGSMLFRDMPERLTAFQKQQPRVEIVLTELNSAEQIDALLRGQIDLGFVHTERVPRELKKMLYRSERFVCCVPEEHPIAREKVVMLDALDEEPFVLFSRDASPDYYERILALCAEQGLQPRVKHEVRHWLSVVSLVSKGMGIALVPRALTDSGIAGVRFLPIPHSRYVSDVYCIWNERQMPAVLPALLETFRT